MPHQCTECGHVFPDGSKEMLSGCPECGGNKFQFRPDGEAEPVDEEPSDPSDPPEPEPESRSRVTEAAARAATSLRDAVGGDTDPEDPPVSTGDPGDDTDLSDDREWPETARAPEEDTAQADARTEMVDEDELPEPDVGDDSPDLSEIRDQLDDQFESIRIVEPGQYELNLMELYDRDEYIIALQENGRYVIEVPDAWRDPIDGDE